MTSADVVIVGGGIVGLSVGYCPGPGRGAASPSSTGRRLGRAASWAGAGMIPPYTERLTTNPTLELRSWSALLYPEWSASLHAETGIDNGFRRTGGVDVAATPQEDDELRSMAGRWRNERVVYERMAPSDFARVEPALNPDLLVAYFLPDRAQIRNPRHIQALQAALRLRGVRPDPACPGGRLRSPGGSSGRGPDRGGADRLRVGRDRGGGVVVRVARSARPGRSRRRRCEGRSSCSAPTGP